MTARLTASLKPCGTEAAYQRHKHHGEEPCDACKQASHDDRARRYALKKAGNPRKPTLRERLLSKAVINWETGCWEWTGSTTGGGYAYIAVDRKGQRAHRLAYEMIEGQIPDGLHLDHLCRVRRCINPAHLEPVTCRENTLRSPISAASRNSAKTHCPAGHEYTPENTVARKQSNGRLARRCLTCQREQGRTSYARRRSNTSGAAA